MHLTCSVHWTLLKQQHNNGLSASDHARDVISKSAQTLYALRVQRAKGMPDKALQVVFRSVIVGKLLYASCAWSGFVSNTDRKRVDAFLRRSKRCGFCPPDLSRFDELLEDADSTPFFIPSTLLCSLSSWLTSSYACHLITVITFVLTICHSLDLSLQT